jgi:hypothetical protein
VLAIFHPMDEKWTMFRKTANAITPKAPILDANDSCAVLQVGFVHEHRSRKLWPTPSAETGGTSVRAHLVVGSA